MMTPFRNARRWILPYLLVVACGDSSAPTPDAQAQDVRVLACASGSDCLVGQRCVYPLETPTVSTCVRGTVPAETQCVPQCRAYCPVGPHTLLNPDDPPGVVAGLMTPDCFDAGPID